MNIGELLDKKENIIYMKEKYLDYNYYLNNKSNIIRNILLKREIRKVNKEFINKNIIREIKFNDVVLDNDQKEAIYTDEINTLVLAGAGSGKTTTIIGKIKYLIEEKNIKENEILCISFTNDSVNDLKDRIIYNIDIFTFHKLALEIIHDYNKAITVVGDYLEYIINEMFLSIISNIDEKTLKYFNNTISSFINIFKNYNYDYSYFDTLIKHNKDKILELIKKVYLIYEDELRSSNYLDFNDIINYSIKLITNKGLKRYYKYIIIDEFQDISENRFLLIDIIRKSCNSKVFSVGDDYQSIYKFAGSNINMITNFKKYFGYTRIIKINNTYRNSNELIKVASDFILKNRHQIRKNLISNKHNNKPIKIIYYYNNEVVKLKKLLYDMDKTLILVRNNYNISNICDEEFIIDKDNITYNNKIYNYKTIHKSKGLEEENVIILGLENSIYGFPNKRRNSINNLLLPKDKYLYEEERRLFYVALTRTKNNVYLFVSKEKPSIFVKEILRKNKKYIEVLDL